MSAPVVSEIQVSPYPVPIGQQATITVMAQDPDAHKISGQAKVRDSAGQVATESFALTVSDPLIYTVAVSTGVVAQDPSDPAVFVWSP